MAKMPSALNRQVPNVTRPIASLDPSVAFSAGRQAVNAAEGAIKSVGRGLQDVEAALYEEHLKDEERAVKNLELEWSKSRREILFGNGTPNSTGFYSTSGEDTVNGRKGVEEKLNKARTQLSLKAGSKRVKEAFDLSSGLSLQGELEQVDRYTIGQRREANSNTSKAVIKEAVQQAATYYSDDKKWDAAVNTIATEMASLGDNEGWSQEVINTSTQEAISKAAQDRISQALMLDSAAGEALYMKSKDMIDGDVRIQIEQDIKTVKKAEEVEKRLAAQEARQAAEDRDKAAFDDYASAIIAGEPVDPKAIAMDKNLDGRSKFALANALETKATRAEQTNPAIYNDLFRRIHLPEGDKNRISDWHSLVDFMGKGINDFTSFNQLRGEVEKQGTEEGGQQDTLLKRTLDNARGSLSGTNDVLGYRDPKGEMLLQKATVEILKAWDAGIKAKKSPYDLANPDHPDYVGKIITQLQRSPEVMMKDLFQVDDVEDAATPGATPEMPKITTKEEYDKLPPGAQYIDGRDNKPKTKGK